MNYQAGQYKRFFIKTLGCKVNQYESQAIREDLVRNGFNECVAEDTADIYIVNTCTVTGKADKESRHWIGLFHGLNPGARIVVTGCYTEKNAHELAAMPGISHIVRNSDKNRMGEILGSGGDRLRPAAPLAISDFKGHSKAFVKIQDGCENSCSYCKVPSVRGPLTSRPLNEILEEARRLVENGFKEIVLTGICLGAWGKDLASNAIAEEMGIAAMGLTDLLKELDRSPRDFRIRLSSIEPRYITGELIEFMSKNKRICRHLHIPFQSGDDEVLRRMNRPYTAGYQRDLAARIRHDMPDIAITTDILTGFPGETDGEFRNTLDFLRDILPARTHIFTFSRREGTPAYNMAPQVAPHIVRQRYCALKVFALTSAYLYRERFLGKRLDILVESKRDKESGLLTGYSDNYIRVLFDGPEALMRKITPVRVEYVNMMRSTGIYEPG
ncbi:MAG: tRNA (N(6)-L-threonylcarbamoyladenosine(37)-C(2))-methylthiotransferase MtaB [Candidatus Omnitrophota bacterium]